jgi:F0F1-type ATP synthase assembly protein I
MKKATKKTKKTKKQKKGKRIIVATLSGVLFGLVCCWLASSSSELSWPVALQIITSRTLIGFAIGISCLAMGHWTIHGLLMGLIFSIPLAFSGLMAPENPEWSKAGMLIATVVMGMIYGFLIEVITSVVFKAKSQG